MAQTMCSFEPRQTSIAASSSFVVLSFVDGMLQLWNLKNKLVIPSSSPLVRRDGSGGSLFVVY